MHTFLNKRHKNNIHRGLLLSCALTVLADSAYAVSAQTINFEVAGGDAPTLTTTLSEKTGFSTSYGKNGAGTLILAPTSANSYTGSTFIYQGVLALGTSNALPATPITISYGATLQANTDVSLTASNTITLTSDSNNAESYISTDSATTDLTIAGVISCGTSHTHALTIQGPGTVTLSGSNTWTGALKVEAGSTVSLIPAAIGSNAIQAQGGSTISFSAGTYSMDIASYSPG